MDKQKLLTLDHYILYVMTHFPESWKRVCITHNVLKQAINAIAGYCYKYKLFDRELYCHMHENELICAAEWDNEPQGVDWWMDLSTEANMLENHGCISTFKE